VAVTTEIRATTQPRMTHQKEPRNAVA
jgi:hypothetical protein